MTVLFAPLQHCMIVYLILPHHYCNLFKSYSFVTMNKSKPLTVAIKGSSDLHRHMVRKPFKTILKRHRKSLIDYCPIFLFKYKFSSYQHFSVAFSTILLLDSIGRYEVIIYCDHTGVHSFNNYFNNFFLL